MALLRRRGWRRLVLVGAWTAAAVVTLLLGWQTKVGPVLIGFTARHGVHLGDLAVAANATTAAALVTHLLTAGRRRHIEP